MSSGIQSVISDSNVVTNHPTMAEPFGNALIELAKENGLKYAVDIYPRYGSDVGAALGGGNNIKGALIGPGVHASHGMERTHYSALENTINLILLYLGCKK